MEARMFSSKLDNGVQSPVGVANVPGLAGRGVPTDGDLIGGGF